MVRVCIVGSGIIGVTTAWQVTEKLKGATVTIYAEKFTNKTTSHVAAGIWNPVSTINVTGDIERIAADSWSYFDGIVKTSEARNAGVTVVDGYHLHTKPVPIEQELYRKFVYHFESVSPDSLTFLPDISELRQVLHFTTLLVECRRYLPWIMEKLKGRGVQFIRRFVTSLEELSMEEFDIIFNCTGLGSEQLVNDKMTPIRGQVIRVYAPWVKQFFMLDDDVETYIFPGADLTVLGGTYQIGDYNTRVDLTDTLGIWNRCKASLVPSLASATIDHVAVGLRPYRDKVRIEEGACIVNPTTGHKTRIIHNYGHGGNGVNLSMGSACAAVSLYLLKHFMGKNKFGNLSQDELTVRCISDIINELATAGREKRDLDVHKLKSRVSRRYGLKSQPKLVDIIAAVPAELKRSLIPKLKVKPVRTASGIAVIAVMSKPHRCPHIATTGNICVYCPGGPDSDFEYSTQSYTGYEPTSMRAIRARYDPFVQARSRLEQLRQLGHDVDKVEFILMGGTFMALPSDYRDSFISSLHNALSGHMTASVTEAVRYSERSKIKCVGMTIETRPDYCMKKHLSEMLNYGVTRLEIGVQSVYEDVARDTNRGHTVKATCDCFLLSKDAGFKVVSHMMPDLPNVGVERDIDQFVEFFENPAFRPDGLKIYPTLVIRGTGLYELWRTGRYKSYPADVLIDLLARILALVPPWTRIYRVQRDIPMPLVTSGGHLGHLRELALARLKDFGATCRDVRTREVGIQELHERVRPNEIELIRRDYFANGGWETFLAYEDPVQDILIGLLRLRKLSTVHKTTPSAKRLSIIRELHVYGSVVPVSGSNPVKFQHHGFGRLLLEEAERISLEEHGSSKLAIISGVGVRNYYRKFGYELEGPYMVKQLARK